MLKNIYFVTLLTIFALILLSCGQKSNSEVDNKKNQQTTISNKTVKLSFVEIGSDKCIPCKQMQPILKSLKTKYAGQLNVQFFDIYKNKVDIQKFKVVLIPTQIILDADGKEIFRHQGFFPESEIDTFLKNKGLTINSTNK
jgi:thioredoxin 1